MKRVVLTVAAAICLSVAGFAAGNQPATENWKGNTNVVKLGHYLGLSSDQTSEVANISSYFNEQMTKASWAKQKNKEALLRNAVYGNLKLMKQTLTPEQYAKYLMVFNATLQNRGIEIK